MAISIFKNSKGTKEEWLQARKMGIGGSDVAAICGISRWKSPLEVYLEKVGEKSSTVDNECVYWGTVLEDLVAAEFSKRLGMKVRRVNSIMQSEAYPFMIANVDRTVVGMPKGLECKTTGAWNLKEWNGDKLPDEYYLQCQHYMTVMEWESMYIAVLVGGQKFLWKEIPRDEEMIQKLVKIEEGFWERILRKIPPEPDGKTSSETIQALFPQAKESSLPLPEEAGELVTEYLHYAQEEKAAKEEKQARENRLKMLLGDHEVGLLDRWKVSWKNICSQKLDTKELKEKEPQIYAQFSREILTRRFQVREV